MYHAFVRPQPAILGMVGDGFKRAAKISHQRFNFLTNQAAWTTAQSSGKAVRFLPLGSARSRCPESRRRCAVP